MTRTHCTARRGAMLLAAALLVLAAKPAAVPPRTFASPEAAADALARAAREPGDTSLVAILGSAAAPIVHSGDPTADANARASFAAAYDAKHHIERDGDAKAVLVYGDDDFPLPIPLVRQGDAWRFDAAAGKKEILARRIGRNELAAIQVCLAYVDAQREYASGDPDGDGLFEYAQKIRSSDGKHDGLYWPSAPGGPESPLGELAAEARSEGYRPNEQGRTPYHGYLYKILKGQGPHAKGGAYDYVVRGRMIGGFALVAYPAEYGNSGVTTFVVNHDGVVYSKDLGPNTAKIASRMTRYDPDSSWKQEEMASAGAPR